MSTRKIDRRPLLLPFLANGTLEPEEEVEARACLERSEAARSEFEFLKSLRTRVGNLDRGRGLTEVERRRVLADIFHPVSAAEPLFATKPWNGLRWALAAALLCAFGEATALWRLASAPAASGGAREVAYRPAGAPSSARIAVQFNERASEAEIRALLLERGLRIAEGPSPLGVYGLVWVDARNDDPALEAELAALRSRADLVVHASAR